jgi:glucose-6-phosphate 1-dehydrogenase
MSDDTFREDLRKSLHQFATRSVEEKIAHRLVGCATYVRGDADDAASYDRLRQALQRIEAERGTNGNRLFYMATPPSAFRGGKSIAAGGALARKPSRIAG